MTRGPHKQCMLSASSAPATTINAMRTRAHDDFFDRGLALFNAGRFFECHEVWEMVWQRTDGAHKLFYQGLIQAAVALAHAERGNWRGAISIYNKARAKLDDLPMIHCGLAVGEFRDALAEFFATAGSAEVSPARPRIRRVK
jgi:uncharacterized protein